MPYQEVTELVNLETDDEKKEVKIGSSLDPSTKKEIVDLLKEYVDIFAWSYQDMPGLSTEIVEHQLPMRPECKPVQQKLKKVKSEMLLKIKEEARCKIPEGGKVSGMGGQHCHAPTRSGRHVAIAARP